MKGTAVSIRKKSSLKKTTIVQIDPDNPSKEAIAGAAEIIRRGGLVAFPTETVYGLAANRNDPVAMAKLSRVKERPADKHYTVHIASVSFIKKMGCKISKPARVLIKKYWPGPLTLVLPSKDGESIGFRMPANKVALELIKKANVPVVAPSANKSGSKPPVKASDVLDGLDGKIDMVLDAGTTKVGVESTVVCMSSIPFKILREGAIKTQELEKVLHNE